jgi:hypothetical protein
MFRIRILTGSGLNWVRGSGSAIWIGIQIRVPDLVSAKACARIRIPSSLKLSEITVFTQTLVMAIKINITEQKYNTEPGTST